MSDMTVARTILSQLGGNRFIAMTGARNLSGAPDALSFRLPGNLTTGRVNYCKVTLTPADDYTVEIGRIRMSAKKGPSYTVVSTIAGVYCDNLRDVFESETGLLTSL